MKLLYKLLLIFLAIAVIPVMVMAYFTYTSSRSSIERDTNNLLQTTNVLKEEQLNQWLMNNQQMLLQISTRPALIDNVAVLTRREMGGMVFKAYRNTLVNEHLIPLQENKVGFLDYIVIGVPDGLILAATDPTLEGKYRESEPFFLEGQKGPYIDAVRYSVSDGQVTLHLSMPIRDHSGRLLAVLVGHANIAEMSRIMRLKTDLTRTQETYLVNQFNFFVTEPMFGNNFALRKIIQTEGVDRCLAGGSGFGSYPNYRGVDVIGYYHWIPEREICILTEMDQSEAFAPIGALRSRVALFGMGTIGLVVLLAGIFSGTLTRPIEQLVKGAEEIGRGHLDYRILVNTGDEVQQLADAFNDMSINLDHNIKRVEYNQRQVMALSQAAQVVQRALSPDQIYQAVGAEVVKLGNQVIILQLEADGRLAIPYISLDAEARKGIEKLLGTALRTYRGEVLPQGNLRQIMTSRESRFVTPVHVMLTEAFPNIAQQDIARIVEELKIGDAILSPLIVREAVWGFLMILGEHLRESDIPAINIFANQAAVALENVLLLENLESERNFINAVLETSNALTLVMDPEGRVIRFNHGCEETTGYTFEEMRGKPIWDELFLPEQVEFAQSKFKELLDGSPDNQYEGYWLGKDGAPHWITWSNAALRDEQGRTQFVVATGIDITEQMLAVEELRKLSQAIQQSPSMVVIMDTAGKIEYANPKFCEITGYTLEEIYGKDLSILTRWSPEETERVWGTLQEGDDWRGKHENFKKNGDAYWVSVTIAPIKDEAGNITHYLKTAEDITEQRAVQQAQERLIAILEATPDIVFSRNMDGKMLNLNRAGRQLLGLGQDDSLQGLEVKKIHPRWASDMISRVGIPAVIENGYWQGETALLDHQGREIPVSQVILAHYNPDGSPAYFSTIARDITERKRFEQELRASPR